jgi:hypothetical protein
MPADEIFVLVLVVGIVLSLVWLSKDSSRRAELERARQEQAGASAAVESSPADLEAPARPGGRRRRKRDVSRRG